MRKIQYIVLHCTAASGDQPTQNVLDYWKKVKKWRYPGYHWLIDSAGLAVRLAPDHQIVNGTLSHKHMSVDICYKGGWEGKDTRTPEQKGMIEILLKQYRRLHPQAKIVGHRDLSPDTNGNGIIESKEWLKLCPCFDAIPEYRNI